MAEVLFDVQQGRRVKIASGTITKGMLVGPHSTAGQAVATANAGIVVWVAATDATTGTEVEIIPIVKGAEFRLQSNGIIAAGAEVQIDTTTGKVITYSSGTKVGRTEEAAAAGGLVKVTMY